MTADRAPEAVTAPKVAAAERDRESPGNSALRAHLAQNDAARRRFTAHLAGHGLDLGPGHQPFACPPGVTVRLVDRWKPDENAALFPELPGVAFPPPDVIADFDTDRLAPIPDQSQDFVICSHLMEHLAEPIGFLTDVHRVLRPGGLALILLPDRRATFDRMRPGTPLAHLIADYKARVTVVDDDHLREFLALTGPHAELPELEQDEAAVFAWLRDRSIHVHCWADAEFPAVLRYGIKRRGWRWHLVDWFDTAPGTDEFGFLLQRSGGRSKRRLDRRLAALVGARFDPGPCRSRTGLPSVS